MINLLYGLAPDHERADLSLAISDYSGRLPKGLLPIGGDLFSNQICLSVSGLTKGLVYFWEHEAVGAEDDPTLLILIANSFEEFVDSFYTRPEDNR